MYLSNVIGVIGVRVLESTSFLIKLNLIVFLYHRDCI